MEYFKQREHDSILKQKELKHFQPKGTQNISDHALNILKQSGFEYFETEKRVPGIFQNKGDLEYFETNGTFKKGYLE